jgi:hypothetical protein
MFTMAVTDSTTYNFYLSTDTATWAEDLLHFAAATVENEIATCTSLTVATMAPTENVYVAIDAFPCTAIRIAKETYPNVLARVPVIAAPGDKNTHNTIDPFFVEIRSPNISNFNVSLLDDGYQSTWKSVVSHALRRLCILSTNRLSWGCSRHRVHPRQSSCSTGAI